MLTPTVASVLVDVLPLVVGGFEWLNLQPNGGLPAVPRDGRDEAGGGGGGGGGGGSWYGFGTIARGAVSVMGSIGNIVYATVAMSFSYFVLRRVRTTSNIGCARPPSRVLLAKHATITERTKSAKSNRAFPLHPSASLPRYTE
jgi:hypothetical protein